MTIDQTLDRIRSFRRDKGLSIAALERLAGLSISSLAEIDDPLWSPTAKTVRKIEAVIPAGWKPRKKESGNG
jgi:transcriptional regulator with XRE-family HTH domain